MKRISSIIIILLFSLIVIIPNITYAENFSYKYISIGEGALENPDTENNKLYVISSALILTSSTEDSKKDGIVINKLAMPEISGIDYNDYHIVDISPYSPNALDFKKDKNIWRVVSPLIKDQKDFDKFMYRPDGIEFEHEYYMLDNEVKCGFTYETDKSMSTLHLSKYLKLPGAEETLADLYQWNESQRKEYFTFFNTPWNEENQVDKHLFTYSMVIELEKISNELPVPDGDFIKALNETEFQLQSHQYVGDNISIYSNLVNEYNKTFSNPQWLESYNTKLGYGIVKFTGVLPYPLREYDRLAQLTGKDKNISVEVYFYVPYSEEEGYQYSTNEFTENTRKNAGVLKFIAEGKEVEYIDEEHFWLYYVETTNEYYHHYNPERVDIIK